MLRGCVIPQGGVLPKYIPLLLPKHTGGNSSQSSSSLSQGSVGTKKKSTVGQNKKATGRKPTLKKGGLGSFTVFSAPKSKVKKFSIHKLFNI